MGVWGNISRQNYGPNDSIIGSIINNPKGLLDLLVANVKHAAGQPTDADMVDSPTPYYTSNPKKEINSGFNLAGLMQTGSLPFAPESAGGLLGTISKFKPSEHGFDPRFDKDGKIRVGEASKLSSISTTVDHPDFVKPKISLADYEGHPFVTSMSDRTNVGTLLDINGVPVGTHLQGGQDYMFNNPGQVWASAKIPANAILEAAINARGVTGKDPLFLPWRMAPSGGDFANMTGETMIRYMSNNMSKKDQRLANKDIKQLIPNFSGIGSEQGIDQFRTAPDAIRKRLKINVLDTKYRNSGGLGIGEARLAVADPHQIIAPDGGLQNVGIISAKNPLITHSGHRAYPRGIPGEGLGVLDRDVMVHQLLPEVVADRGMSNPLMPSDQDIRSLQMKPYVGLLTADLLKSLGY